MATQTVTIYGSGSACTNSGTPSKPDTAQTIIAVGDTAWNGGNYIQGYEKFVPPTAICGKKAVSASLYVYARKKQTSFTETTGGSDLYAIAGAWDPARTTHNNRPAGYSGKEIKASLSADFAWRRFDLSASDAAMIAKAASFGICLHNYFEYYTSNSDHKPYIVVTVEDGGGLRPSLRFPKGGFVDNKKGCAVEWGLDILAGTVEPVTQAKAMVSWTYGGTTKTATVTGTAQRYTIPAAQLPETGTVTWTVAVTDSGGNTNSAASSAEFSTTDSTLFAAPVSPINQYVDGSQAIPLRWRYSISTGTSPTKADFQTSTDGGTTWATLGSVTGTAAYNAAPGALPAGSILWRVRGYNTDGVAGPWSDPAAIVVRQAPKTPVIAGVTAVPRPTVSWQAEGQQAYQLQVGSWDSGPVYGTGKSAQVPVFLPAGAAAVRLRVQNSFGLWSPWAAAAVTVANRMGEQITLRSRTVTGGVRLSWTTTGSYPAYAVYRDGVQIGETAGKEYTDYCGIGKASYFVRGIKADSTYTDSPEAIEILRLRSGLIARVGVWDWMHLECRVGSRPARGGSEEADVTLTSYSGRVLPVAEISRHRRRAHSYTYSVQSWAEMRRLAEMSGERVVYKHRDGDLAVGLMGGVSWTRNRSRWDVSFTITEVDHGTAF